MASLRSLTILFLAAVGGATVLTGYATFSASRNTAIALVDRRIDSVASAMLSDIRPGDARVLRTRIAAFARSRDTGDIGFVLTDAQGRRVGGNVAPARVLPPGFSSLDAGDGIAGLSAGRAEVRDAGGGLRLTTVVETEPIDGYAERRASRYALGFGAILLIVAAGTAGFGMLVRRRIAEVCDTAGAIVDGDMRRRVPVDPGGGAFAVQAEAFNHMLDRIALHLEAVRGVSNDVAHDLRTPLSRLRARLATIAATAPTSGAADDLDDALSRCDAIIALFAAILRIADIESGDRRAAFRPLDPAALVKDVVETMAGVAAESGHLLRAGRLATTRVDGDPQLVSQALLNLVENALRHTPAGSIVTVSVEIADGGAAISVRDDGPGIAADSRALALRRFGRLDASRNLPGHGLGLPLVAAIARLHGGTLTLADASPGLVATMTFGA